MPILKAVADKKANVDHMIQPVFERQLNVSKKEKLLVMRFNEYFLLIYIVRTSIPHVKFNK